MTTRSGRYAAIASTFGVKPESAVLGTFFGKSDWLSTATTCGPAPIENRDSVGVGESETMRAGRLVTVTLPLEAMTVTGNDAVDAFPPEAPATDRASTANVAATSRASDRST